MNISICIILGVVTLLLLYVFVTYQTFLELSIRLSNIENDIADARKCYNEEQPQ